MLDALGPIRLIVPDGDIVRRAVEARAEYGVHLYDGMIVAAAERGGCGRIWSEDLNAGRQYFGIAVENPFRSNPVDRITPRSRNRKTPAARLCAVRRLRIVGVHGGCPDDGRGDQRIPAESGPVNVRCRAG